MPSPPSPCSKLAVRLQATWALGNLLLLILPLRQKDTFSPFSASFALASVSVLPASPSPSNQWTSDRMWFALCDISMCLLEDRCAISLNPTHNPIHNP